MNIDYKKDLKDKFKSFWPKGSVFVRDEEGQILAEFDMDIGQDGSKIWSMQRYNYNLFGKNIAADRTGEDVPNMRVINPVTYRRYYFHDHLGNVRAVTDENGQLLYNYEYWPYGEEYTSSEFNEDSYRYTGHERDYDLNMDYMKSRHYKYEIGRFQQPDPVNGSIENAMSWNLYTYVQNNPLNFTDPFGLMQAWKTVPPGKDTPQLSTRNECPIDCPFDGKKCDCPANSCDIDPNTGAYICGEETVEVIGKAVDPADIGFIAELIAFLNLANQPSMHDFKPDYNDPVVQVIANIIPDFILDEYQQCQADYIACLADVFLPINPFSASTTFVTTGLNEIAKDYEDKALGYYYKNFYRLKKPGSSIYIWKPLKTAKLLGKISAGISIGVAGYGTGRCTYKYVKCLSK